MKTIDELEARIQSLIEVNLMRYIPGYKPEDQVPHLLAAAMHGSLVKRGENYKAPNIYTIIAHPSTLTHWNADPHLLSELANALLDTGTEAGFSFSSRPKVTSAADSSMKPDEVRVLASYSTEPLAETRDIATAAPPEGADPDSVPPNAFLILDGTKIIPLNRSVVNIGRRLGNHVIIDDPRISRSHAQVRFVKGRFVLFDLESTGGTFINGRRASQTVLYPGDVISLAGVSLIFGQDLPPGRVPEERTTPGSSLSSDRPTAVLNPNKDK
jgi:FHA domain/FhaA, N-terminal domain